MTNKNFLNKIQIWKDRIVLRLLNTTQEIYPSYFWSVLDLNTMYSLDYSQ